MPATTKRLHLTRHAQAEHNVAEDYSIPDAPLTALGKEQSKKLDDLTRNTVQQQAELLVCSPLRRPMETMLLGYSALKDRLTDAGHPVVLLDTLQEVGPYPCDTPTYPVSALEASNGGMFAKAGLDFSALSPDYASKKGIYDPSHAAERAKGVRKWLRAREENEIVVVAHGDILRYLADGQNSARPWANAEVKLFTFSAEDDEEAALVEIKEEAKPGPNEGGPTSSGKE
ncbi:hypothetical protein P7C73_g5236, partial [Tremellales sp. Uapishka_1]